MCIAESDINDIHTPGNNRCLNSGQINMSFVRTHSLLSGYIFMMIITHFIIMMILTITLYVVHDDERAYYWWLVYCWTL